MSKRAGTVVWFNNAKGFGFLRYAGGDVSFTTRRFSKTKVNKSLNEGEEVEFDSFREAKAHKLMRYSNERKPCQLLWESDDDWHQTALSGSILATSYSKSSASTSLSPLVPNIRANSAGSS